MSSLTGIHSGRIKVRQDGRILPCGAIQVTYENWQDDGGDYGGVALWGERLLKYAKGGFRAKADESWVNIIDVTGNMRDRIPFSDLSAVEIHHGIVMRSSVVIPCGEFGRRRVCPPIDKERLEGVIRLFEQAHKGQRPERYFEGLYMVTQNRLVGEHVIVLILPNDDRLLFAEDGTSLPCFQGDFASRWRWEPKPPPYFSGVVLVNDLDAFVENMKSFGLALGMDETTSESGE